MIRVNLLPIRQARRRSAGKTQLVVFAALVALLVAVLAMLYVIEAGELERLQSRVAENEQQVAAAQEEVKDAEQLEADKTKLEQQLGVLKELEKQRTGPVKVLDELQGIMSPPRNEEDRFAQLQRNWNVDWDPRRLWVEDFSENEGKFSMKGGAVNADDVAEFLQRLTTATHFRNVQLDVVEAKEQDGAKVVNFSLFGDISYSGEPAAPQGS